MGKWVKTIYICRRGYALFILRFGDRKGIKAPDGIADADLTFATEKLEVKYDPSRQRGLKRFRAMG
jgi:hypothetical protein